MNNSSFEAAIRTAERVNAAKVMEEVAWHNWLASDTVENKAIFLAARAAWLQAVREWKVAVNEASQTVVPSSHQKSTLHAAAEVACSVKSF